MDVQQKLSEFSHSGMKELATLLISEMNLDTRAMESTEKVLDFPAFIQEQIGDNAQGEQNEALWFKFRIYKEWVEERITILREDVRSKLNDPVIRIKFHNNERLLQLFLRRYWNRVVRTLNNTVRGGCLKELERHRCYLLQRGGKRNLLPEQTEFL